MLLFSRNKPPVQSKSADSKSQTSSSSSYRRRSSVPSLSLFAAQPPSPTTTSTPRRAPLASLDPQIAAAFAPDYTMSPTSASQPIPLADPSKDVDRSTDPSRLNIGRPITSNRAMEEDVMQAIQSSRRKSLTNQNPSSATRPLPHSQSRLAPRRPHATSPAAALATRRPSIPGVSSLSLTSPTQSSISTLPNDDIYSGLSSFTFGAAQSSIPQTAADAAEMISPLTKLPDSTDHTPRPSVSGPSGTKPSSRSRSGKQKAADDAIMGDDEYEDEDDNERRKSRSKMRAIDDGSRRPSLPTNVYNVPETQPSTAAPSTSTTSTSDPLRQMSPGSNSEQETSEADNEEQGELDTDVEFDLQQHISTEEVVHPDDASQHTFGGGFDHYGFREGRLVPSDQMSIAEEEEDDEPPEPTMSPVTFYRPELDDDEDLEETDTLFVGSTDMHAEAENKIAPWARSGPSLPIDASTSAASRQREDSMATVTAVPRARRSTIDFPTPPITPAASSATRIDTINLDPQQSGSDTTATPVEAPSNAYDGFKLDYIFDDDARRHSISQTSFVAHNHNNDEQFGVAKEISPFSWVPLANVSAGRRPSTITVGTTAGEDVFTRHLRKNDERYNLRRLEWSCKKESTDGRGPRNMLQPPPEGTVIRKSMMPGTQELWKHAYIGRFKVDRLLLGADQPDKAPQQRVNVRHVADPYSKGNARGGPSSVIHKHSRAIAFSIFRTHALFSQSSRRANTHMSTSVSILLATKKVQEQYTSTRTTSKLNSHGLLEDRPSETSGSPTSSGTTAATTAVATTSTRASSQTAISRSQRERSNTRTRGRPQTAEGANVTGAGRTGQLPSARGAQPTTVSASASPSRSPGPNSAPSSPLIGHIIPPPPVPVAPTEAASVEAMRAYDRTTSLDSFKPSMTSSPSLGSETMHEPSSSSSQGVTSEEAEMDDDEEEVSPPRTSHAEAFATVDSQYLEYVRGRHEQRVHHHHPDHDSSHSLVGALRRKFLGQSASKTRGVPHTMGLTSASLEGHYTPPWITMAPRSKVEERERVIQNLNESFKDVGLLPSFRAQRNNGQTKPKRGKQSSSNIFANVPIDSLYMLLPLWPGETDAVSAERREDPNNYIVPVEERQYLLVYYVPFDERSKKKRDKKRTREEVHKGSQTRGGNSGSQGPNISLESFRICARLVSYSDMRETGVRLPDYGLSITGSMTEATRFLPSPSIREMALDDIVIGVCHTRETGMEFLPEGLVKLGLCMPTDEPARLPLREEEEAEELDVQLTPIGRAAVEMAWLGSMAVTCFGPS